MGGIKRTKKTYENPRKRWSRTRIEEEKLTKNKYGLKNKKELRIFETFIRKKRQNAKNLLAMPLELRLKREKELIKSLARYGILPENATLDDVLSLQTEEVLEKRLQTIVWKQNLALTPLQARQFIVHGHIAIDGEKVTSPNYLVQTSEMDKIGYFGGTKMQLEPPKPETKAELKKEFEEVAKEEQKERERTKEQEAQEEEKQETQEQKKEGQPAADKEPAKPKQQEQAKEKQTVEVSESGK